MAYPIHEHLVTPNHSHFIKGRAIHDNFRVVQSTTKLLHARQRLIVLLKIVITKGFDMGVSPRPPVAFEFLLTVD
jgi:hypothetical protein